MGRRSFNPAVEARWGKKSGWTLLGVFAAAVVILSANLAKAQFGDLIVRLPKSANAVVLLNIEKIVNSPMGIREGWGKKIEKSFAAGLIRVPPQATNYVLASQIDLEFMEPIWSAAVMDLSERPSLPEIAKRRGGTVDKLDDLSAVALPNDTYIVRFGPTTIGAMQPANRQSVLRWVREAKTGKNGELSPYLQKAASFSDNAGTEIIMAIDLDGALSWERAAKYLNRHKQTLKLTDDQVKEAAGVVSNVEGLRLGVRLTDRPFGKLMIDFRTSPAALASVAKPLVLQVLADAGLRIDDLDEWKPESGPTTLSLSGYLTTSGLRRALSMIDSPTSSESTGQSSQSESSAERSLTTQAKASQDHYHAVIGMANDLKKDMGSVANLASTQTYFDKYAKRIERLPILNVDPELLSYSAFVAKSLRAASGAVRTMGIQSGVRQAEINSSDAGAAYGRYGAWGGYGAAVSAYDRTADARGIESERRVVRAEEKADAATNIQQLRAAVIDATASIRRKMTEKYQVEF
jgi:hypothetical protein